MLFCCLEFKKQNLVIEDNVDDSKRDQQTKKMEREKERHNYTARVLLLTYMYMHSSKSYFHGNTLKSCGWLDH